MVPLVLAHGEGLVGVIYYGKCYIFYMILRKLIQ